MPLENLEEEGLPKNPDLRIAQLRFLLSLQPQSPDPAVRQELMAAIRQHGKETGETGFGFPPPFRATFGDPKARMYKVNLKEKLKRSGGWIWGTPFAVWKAWLNPLLSKREWGDFCTCSEVWEVALS